MRFLGPLRGPQNDRVQREFVCLDISPPGDMNSQKKACQAKMATINRQRIICKTLEASKPSV